MSEIRRADYYYAIVPDKPGEGARVLSALQQAGNCVNNQNIVVPAGSPSCTGFAAVGNIGRNRFRGPFQQNWDMSFIKTTKITEQSNVEFRAEFFNIWNHAAFQSPQAAGTDSAPCL